MSTMFGRKQSTDHPYDPSVRIWLQSAVMGERAMARNMMHDHRVTEPREQKFDSCGGHPRDPLRLRDAIVDYFNENVRSRGLPDYVYEDINNINILNRPHSARQLIHKDVELARLLDLNGLGLVFQWAKANGMREFRDFPGPISDASLAHWLGKRLFRPGTEIRHFISAVIEAMNKHALQEAFQPTWATTWSAFEPYLSRGPECWLATLGIHKATAGRWIIVLRYSVREAGTLARPTQLDSGWHPFHFPSPPEAPLHVGGHPADLGGSIPKYLLPEFIHKQIQHRLEHWTNAGSRCERTDMSTSASCENQRRKHLSLLVAFYGRRVLRWMPDCL